MLAHLVVWYLVFLFSTTFHEFAHALAAKWGGDETAYAGGFVTLDPLPHIRRSPFGLVLVPLLSFIQSNWMLGWASVPYDLNWSSRHPRRQAVMSLAGPLSNFLLAVVAFGVLKVLLLQGVVVRTNWATFGGFLLPAHHAPSSLLGGLVLALSVLLDLNLLLGVFNLLPVPPLDGAGVIIGFSPSSFRDKLRGLASSSLFQILGLVLCWMYAGQMIGPVRIMVLRWLLF